MSKMLDKVSKLLAQAENAGTPEEAAAFMAKVQELATANGIELSVARAHQAKKERTEFPEERRIQCNPHTRRHNRKHFAELCMYVCDANDIKYLVGGHETAIHAVGFPSDLDMTEALFTHLSIQMVSECDAALARGDNTEIRHTAKQRREPIPEDERPWGELAPSGDYSYNDSPGWPNSKSSDAPSTRLVDVTDEEGNVVYENRRVAVVDGRVFRNGFYSAFTRRISARLWDAKRAAERDAGAEDVTSSTGLALRDKAAEVDKAHEEQRAGVKYLGTYNGSAYDNRRSDGSGTGHSSGRRAAESAALGTAHSLPEGRKALK